MPASQCCIRPQEDLHHNGWRHPDLFCVTCAAELEQQAGELRAQLIFPSIELRERCEVAWAHDDIQGQGRIFDADASGRTFDPFLKDRGLERGDVPRDGLCQYRSICKAAFGDHIQPTTLQQLAVKFLRIYKKEYRDRMQVYINDDAARDGERTAAVNALYRRRVITQRGYDGFMEALALGVGDGVEFGNEFTLLALGELLHIRIRVLINSSFIEAILRIYKHEVNPNLGPGRLILGTIYVAFGSLHYTDVQELPRLEAQSPQRSMKPSNDGDGTTSCCSEYEAVETKEYDGPMHIFGHPVSELYEGKPADPGYLWKLIPDGHGYARLFKIDLRTNSMQPVGEICIEEPKLVINWKLLRSSKDVKRMKQMEEAKKIAAIKSKESNFKILKNDQELTSEEFWRQKLSPLLDANSSNLLLLSNKLLDAVRHWSQRLNKSALLSQYVDSELKSFQSKLCELQREHFGPTMPSEPRVVIVGVEGSGKSTNVNCMIRSAMKTREQLQDYEGEDMDEDELKVLVNKRLNEWKVDLRARNVFMDTIPSERVRRQKEDIEAELRRERCVSSPKARMKTELTRIFHNDEDVNMDEILRIEATLLQKLIDAGIYDYVDSGDILLATENGGATTALISKIRFNPYVREITIRLRYCERIVVESVLRNAEAMVKYWHKAITNKSEEGLLEVADDDELPEADELPELTDAYNRPVNMDMEIYRACALLGLCTSGGNGHEVLEKYKGEFKLPERFNKLLDRVRVITIEGSDPEAMLSKLAQQLMLHTMDWSNERLWPEDARKKLGDDVSHWATVESVEITIPSQKVDFSIWDVPGFGDEQTNSYRQSIIREALEASASMLLVCCKHEKMSYNMPIRKPLQDYGILRELLGDLQESRIGCLGAVMALDWMMASSKKQNETTAKLRVDLALKDMQGEMTFMFKSTLTDEKPADATKRVEQVLKLACQPYVIDAKGVIDKRLMDGNDAKSMKQFMDSLHRKCESDRIRRQKRFMSELINTVLLPFYQITLRCCQLGELTDAARAYMEANVPKLEPMLKGVKAMLNPEGDFTKTPQLLAKKFRSHFDKVVSLCGPDDVEAHWRSEEFESWRRKGSKQLGIALRSATPQSTLLKKLVCGPLEGPSQNKLLQSINDELDAMKDQLLAPLEGMSKMIEDILTNFAKGSAEESLQINALAELIRREYHVAEKAMNRIFKKDFARSKSELRHKLEALMNDEMRNAPSRCFSGFPEIFKKFNKNELRKDYLKKISKTLNTEIAGGLEALIADIFVSIRTFFETEFKVIVTTVHGVLTGAKKLEGTEADDALGIDASRQYSRFCVVVINALLAAANDPEQEQDLEFIKEIIKADDLHEKISYRLKDADASLPSSSYSTLMSTPMLSRQAKSRGEESSGASTDDSSPRKKQHVRELP